VAVRSAIPAARAALTASRAVRRSTAAGLSAADLARAARSSSALFASAAALKRVAARCHVKDALLYCRHHPQFIGDHRRHRGRTLQCLHRNQACRQLDHRRQVTLFGAHVDTLCRFQPPAFLVALRLPSTRLRSQARKALRRVRAAARERLAGVPDHRMADAAEAAVAGSDESSAFTIAEDRGTDAHLCSPFRPCAGVELSVFARHEYRTWELGKWAVRSAARRWS
jgi:hypothetical protein